VYNPDRVVAINKNSGLSKLLRATLKSNSYLSRFIYRPSSRYDPKGSPPTFKAVRSQVAGGCANPEEEIIKQIAP